MRVKDISTIDYDEVIERYNYDDEYNNEIAIFRDASFSRNVLSDKPTRLDMMVFAFCTKGVAEFQINLKSYTIESGDMVILFPGQIVYNKDASVENCILISVSRKLMESLVPANKSLMNLVFYIFENPVIKIDKKGEAMINGYIDFMLERIKDFKSGNTAYGNEIITGLGIALFYEVIDIVRKKAEFNDKPLNRKHEILRRFLKLLAEYYNENRTVAFYADKMCMSPKHVSHVIKELTGKTVGTWIDDHVIMEAKVLLKSSNMSVQEIAHLLNFSTQSFFGKYFKKRTGMRPGEYRNS